MHGSRDVDIYLHSASRPIFEDCEGLRFAPLPAVYVSLSSDTFGLCQRSVANDSIDDAGHRAVGQSVGSDR
jgi:hypothetical protein